MGARQSNISASTPNLQIPSANASASSNQAVASNSSARDRRASSHSTARAPHSHHHQSPRGRANTSAIEFFSPHLIGQSSSNDAGQESNRERRQSLISLGDEIGSLNRFLAAQSLPVQLLPFALHTDFKCPFCSKTVPPDDADCHLVMCFTKPRISYNEDILTDSKGECVICLEDLEKGNVIARLPCLCVYHKKCIDEWFGVNRSCPEHPMD